VLFGVNNFIYHFFLHVSPLDKHGFWDKQLNKVYIKKNQCNDARYKSTLNRCPLAAMNLRQFGVVATAGNCVNLHLISVIV
jgi:hypothetical protein